MPVTDFTFPRRFLESYYVIVRVALRVKPDLRHVSETYIIFGAGFTSDPINVALTKLDSWFMIIHRDQKDTHGETTYPAASVRHTSPLRSHEDFSTLPTAARGTQRKGVDTTQALRKWVRYGVYIYVAIILHIYIYMYYHVITSLCWSQ